MKNLLKIGTFVGALATSALAQDYSNMGLAKLLGVKGPTGIDYNLSNGYKSTLCGGAQLRNIAGVYAGTVDNSGNGSFSQVEDQASLVKAMSKADIDGNGVITDKEVMGLVTEVLGNAYGVDCREHKFEEKEPTKSRWVNSE